MINKQGADLEILCDLTHKTLEWKLADEELCRLLVTTDFTECDSTRAEAMRLLDTSSGDLLNNRASQSGIAESVAGLTDSGGLASCLGCELLTGGFACSTRLGWGLEDEYEKTFLPPVDLRAVCLVRAIRK